MPQYKIEYRKERDFGTVISDSLKFLKQNFKPLFGSIILIIGPFILVAGFAYSYMQANILSSSLSSRAFGQNMFNSAYFTSMGLIYLLLFVNSTLLNSVVFNYMNLYNQKTFGEKIAVAEVAAAVWSNIGRVLLSMAIFIVTLIVLVSIIVLIGIGISSMGTVILVLLGIAVFFGLLILLPVWLYYISAGFFVVVRDGNMILFAIAKVRKYTSGSFWWTWLIMVIALIGVGILQFLFNLPATIITLTETFSRMKNTSASGLASSETNIWLLVSYTVGMFLTTCSSSILHLICAFNFLGNEEKKEGKGLAARMDEII